MYAALPRPLPYPLDRASNLEVLTPENEDPCGLPAFPEDSDEDITVIFRLSLNKFVALATAIDVGSDIAYSTDGIKVWYMWQAAVMCAQFCEEVALCLTNEDPAVVAALASLITNNQTIINAISNSITNAGGAIPGQPLSPQQMQSDTLPPNVKNETGECELNALWGACLFLVQSGNRTITDFFEQVEAASNTLETTAIVAQTIPAAGAYASAAVEFADQLQETLAEGYAGAYTETYENELACALFCAARAGCELTPDMLIQVMAERVGYIEGTENFGVIMEVIGVGVWTGSAIADTAFWMYFGALAFGQQFGDTLGIRPLTDLMSLGADQLNSDNWETLCDCPDLVAYNVGIIGSCNEGNKETVFFTEGEPFIVTAYQDTTYPDYYMIALKLPAGDWNVTLDSFDGTIVAPSDGNETAYAWMDTSSSFHNAQWNAPATPADFGSHDTTAAIFNLWCNVQPWNAVLINKAPFTATFTVTAL